MAYQLHIERNPPISLNEWLDAIRGQASLKEDESVIMSMNPNTGEKILIPGRPGDVSVFIANKWIKTFNWRRDHVSFNAPRDMSLADPTMATAFRLATTLSAIIRGDEGEVYPCAN